jgi:gluconolactonase
MRLLTWVALAVAVATAGVTAQDAPAQGRGRGAAPPRGVRQVTVAAIPGVIAAGAKWTLVWQGTDNADGLVGMPDGSVLFAQEQPNRVRKLDVAGETSVFTEDTHGAGSLSLDAQGRLFAVQRTCTDPGRNGAPCNEPTAVAIIYPVAARKTLATDVDGKGLGRVNDLVVDKRGGVYFTSGGAFYMNPQGKVSTIGENLRTNGIMLSRDERTLYVTNGATVAAFDVNADGSATNQREFGKLEGGGSGDGLAIDADGRLYVTSNPGVQVLSPEGKYLGLIPTPRGVISVAFAGPDKKTMYVVGSGASNPDGSEVTTPQGVRNNAKTIFRIPTIAQGFMGRAK